VYHLKYYLDFYLIDISSLAIFLGTDCPLFVYSFSIVKVDGAFEYIRPVLRVPCIIVKTYGDDCARSKCIGFIRDHVALRIARERFWKNQRRHALHH